MAGTEVRFSATEWKLLARLAAKPGQVLSTASRVIQLWDGAFYQQGPYLRTWISRLRLKLKSELDAPSSRRTRDVDIASRHRQTGSRMAVSMSARSTPSRFFVTVPGKSYRFVPTNP